MIEFVLLAFFTVQSGTEDSLAQKRAGKAEAQHVEIQSLQLTGAGKKHQFVYQGNVRARRGTLRLKCDKLIGYMNADDSALMKLECIGNAEAQDGDKWARGERADFDNLNGVLVVTGSPQARQAKHQMWGTKVSFTVGQDMIEVENARTVFDTSDSQDANKKSKGTK